MAGSADLNLVLSFEDARHRVEQHAAHVGAAGTELVQLSEAPGRVLAERITADRDIPPFPRATRDGYAVRSEDLAALPATLHVIAEIRAGVDPGEIPSKLTKGQAASIMTGGPVPAGADAVVMVEYTSSSDDRVEISRGISPGENIVPAGAEAARGALLAEAGTRLNQATIALAASVGKSLLSVYRRPTVAVLTTGDEIVDVDRVPGPTQIRNSNSHSLAAQIAKAGGDPRILPIAPDEKNRLRELIEDGLKSDLLILTGGVSMGRYDLVEQVLSDLNAEFFFTGSRIQPGKPAVFGRIPRAMTSTSQKQDARYFFGLPGNPVSTMVTFELFARPMLEALAGQTPRKLMFVRARLKKEVRTKPGLKRFLPAMLSGEFENIEVELVRWQGSGDIAATARANCYLVVPPDRESIPAGEWVPVLET